MNNTSLRKFSKTYTGPPPQQATNNGRGRISVDHSTDPSQFLPVLAFSLLRKPVFINIKARIGFYLCLAFGLSIITDLIKVPPSYFSSKQNILNTFFAKWGWGWTIIPLTAFTTVSSLIYTGSNQTIVRGHLMRMAFGSFWWFIWTNSFRVVENATGHCFSLSTNATLAGEVRKSISNRRACINQGGNWNGFDISGHCFLMVLCNLWIMEELRVMKHWNKFCDTIYPNGRQQARNGIDAEQMPAQLASLKLDIDQLKKMRSNFDRLTNIARILFNFLACLSILWDFIFFCTVMYFHTMPTKCLGTLFALASWYISYHIVFPLARSGAIFGLAPGLPGDGLVTFMPRPSD